MYEQNCQVCHGAELKGDRGPEIDTAVSRLGADGSRSEITNGRGGMPAFSSLPAQSMNELMEFLSRPDMAPPGSAPAKDAVWFARASNRCTCNGSIPGPCDQSAGKRIFGARIPEGYRGRLHRVTRPVMETNGI